MKLKRFVNFIFRNYCFLAITLLISFNSSAKQNSPSQKPSKELEESYKANKNTNPEKAEVYAEELYQLAIKENNRKKIAKALYRKAFIQKNLRNSSKALGYIDMSLKISKQINNDTLALQNTNLMGILYSREGNYKEAIKYYLEAKSIARRLGNLNDILVISRNIGIIKKQTEDYTGALEVFFDNLHRIKSFKVKNFEREKALTYHNLADTYLRMEDYKQARSYTDSSLLLISKNNISDLYIPLYTNKAIINFQQEKYRTAITICDELVLKITKNQNEKALLTPYLYLGKSYFKLQELNTAITYFEKIKTIVNTHNITFPELEETYSFLVKCYMDTNNSEKANANFDLLTEFDKKKEAINRDVNRKIYKEFDIANLESELATLNLKNDQQKKKLTYVYLLAALTAILCIIFYWKKQSRNNKRFNVLLQTIKELEKTQKEKAITNKRASRSVTPENVEHILKTLDKFEENELFLNTQCSLMYVAKKLKTNTSYLSKVINVHKGKSFKSYLAELRVNASLIHLKNNKKLRSYTIKALAEEFGFKTQETFSKAFKSQTGIYPSVYIKNLQKEKL